MYGRSRIRDLPSSRRTLYPSDLRGHLKPVPNNIRTGLTKPRYDGPRMKLPSPLNLPEGVTPAERLDMAFRKVLPDPKTALLRKEAKEKRPREKRRAKNGPKIHLAMV